jgi:hypothetical protein
MSLAALATSALAGCVGQTLPPHPTSTRQPTPTAYLYNGCPVTPLQHAFFEPDRRYDISALPWIQAVPTSSGITGHLFYAPKPLPLSDPFLPLYTNGMAPGGAATKILWIVEHGNSYLTADLDITGTELALGSGSFHETFPRATATDIPSIVDVPTPGCWRLTLTTGPVTGTVVFWVIAS